MTFNDKLNQLTKTCLDLLRDADKEELEYSPSIKKSVKNCKSLLAMLMSDEDKKVKIMSKFDDFFKSNYDNFIKDYMVEDGGEKVPSDAWLTFLKDAVPGPSGHRGLVLAPSQKKPTICIPFSEIYELAFDLSEKSEEDYGYYVPRLVYMLLTLMSAMKVKGDDGKLIDTEDIDLVATELEEDANIKGLDIGAGMGDMVKEFKDMNFDPSMITNMTKDLSSNGQLNDIMGMVGGLIDKVKDGGSIQDIIGGLSGKPIEDVDPNDQD